MATTPQQPQKKILLIEDDPAYRTVVLTTLRKAGVNCTICVDGDHAMKQLAKEKFDLLIVDYLLPGPNAVEIVRWTRAQGINTPALIITNYPSEDLHQHTPTLGATKILAKTSFSPSNMPSIIQEMLNAR